MSIKSTLLITRKKAIEIIQAVIDSPNVKDTVIADLAETAMQDESFNFTVVSEEEFNRNKLKEFPNKYIE